MIRPSAVAICTEAHDGNAWARLAKYLKALHMYTGQSVHSTRRGNMIHRQRQQHLQDTHSLRDIGKNAKYTDVHRPTRFKAK